MSLGLVRMAVLLSSETTIGAPDHFRSEKRVLHDPRSPQHFEAKGTGCAAAVGIPQNDDLHVRILIYAFFAARGRVSCSSCFSRRAGTLKHGVIGDTTGGRAGRPTFDSTLRLVAELHWPVHAMLSGGDPHCFVCLPDQPAFETCRGDVQLCQHRARRPSVRRDGPGAVACGKPYDLGKGRGRALG